MRSEIIHDLPCAIGLILLLTVSTAFADNGKATVHFRLIDDQTGNTTPAMVCITGHTGNEIRLPPDGRVCDKPSETDVFYKGIRFDPDQNWIGPVRKTKGRGNNDDRSDIYELRRSLPYWDEPAMYQTSGDFTIELPAGTWRIAAEHGMEYVPIVEHFTISGNEEDLTKNITLKRWINLPKLGWWSGDVHVHHPNLKPEHRDFMLSWAEAEDVHIVNLLEMGHHKGTDFKQLGFGPQYRAHRGDYWIVPGQEEPRSTFGHIIGLNTSEMARVKNIEDYDFYDLNFRQIHEQPDALVGFAHQAWNGCGFPRGFPWYVTTGEIDFIELLQFGLLNTMDYHDFLNLGFRLTAAAGSDVPWGSTIGEVRTFVHTGPKLDATSWFAGLAKGNTFVSNGPGLIFTVDGKLPGSELVRKRGDKVRITARAMGQDLIGLPRALSIVSNPGVIRETLAPDGKPELTCELELTIERSCWIAATVVCTTGTLAHTTPVYVVVDGEPTWCPKRGPLVIESQLRQIGYIAEEFPDTGKHGQGIHERLNKARAYYADLRERMVNARGS